MIPRQIVAPVLTETTTEWKDSGNTFAFRPDRKWHWVQRFCFWVLRKIRAYQSVAYSTSTAVRLDRDKLMPAVYALLKEATKSQFNSIERIVMGGEDFRRLMESPDLPRSMALNVPGTLLGFPLQVVPWIEGVMVIPRLLDTVDPSTRDKLWGGFEYTDEELHYRGRRP